MCNDLKKDNRIYYLDILRGLAVLFMVMQHCILVFEKTEGNATGVIGTIFMLLGTAPAAPIFMIIMGIFIGKSKKSTKTFLTRGIKLLVAGYALNFIRFSLPLIIGGEYREALSLFFYVDIFQLAGLFYLAAPIFKKFSTNKLAIPIVVVFIVIISPYLWGITSNPITDLLWGESLTVSFPFFPWVVYPLIGMYLSPYLGQAKIEGNQRKLIISLSVLMVILGFVLLEVFPYQDYSRFGFGATTLMIGFVLLYMIIVSFVVSKLKMPPSNTVLKTIIYWSKEISNIYIISWILFAMFGIFLGFNLYSDLISAGLGVLVMIITHVLVRYTKLARYMPKI